MNDKKFRPREYPGWWLIKEHLRGCWYPALVLFHNERKLARNFKLRTFSQLHYLSGHSVSSTKRWQFVEMRFLNRYKRSL